MKRRYRIKVKNVCLAIISLVAIIAIIVIPFACQSKEPQKTSVTKVITPKQSDYNTVTMQPEDMSKGNLILVNNEIPYNFANEDSLVSVYDVKNKSYKVRDKSVLIHKDVTNSLNLMMQNFQHETGENSVIALSGFRSFDHQQQMYIDRVKKDGEATASGWVAEAGGSEHHTGLALDFGIFYDNGRSGDFKGKGKHKWINENCYQYGFIVRYTDEKKEFTGINDEPWHFRYVGEPHANIMYEKNMCLEEYIEYLKGFKFNKQHLEVTSLNNQKYEIYCSSGLTVSVPKDREYSISGNNVDGFIVTVKQ